MARTMCPICCSNVATLRRSPSTCKRRHTREERACNQCWKAHISTEIEARDPDKVKCLFCDSIMKEYIVASLAGVIIKRRYDGKLRIPSSTNHLCQNRYRESKPASLQFHDPDTHGRVFECKYCNSQTCTTCGLPEHTNETCEQVEDRIHSNPVHAEDIAAIQVQLAKYSKCPSCKTLYIIEDECGHTECVGCGYRLCKGCLIPWVGEGSAYLGGKAAHGDDCIYRDRDRDSDHTLHGRFDYRPEVARRNAEKDEANRIRNEAKKAARATEGEGEEKVTKSAAKPKGVTKSKKEPKPKKLTVK